MGTWLAVREWPGFPGSETRYEDLVAEALPPRKGGA